MISTCRAWIAAALILFMPPPAGAGAAADPPRDRLIIGSKAFTESIVLGEIAALMLQSSGRNVEHRRQLGGTRVLWNALLRGEPRRRTNGDWAKH